MMKKEKLTIDKIVEIEAEGLSEEDRKSLLNISDDNGFAVGYRMYLRNEYVDTRRIVYDDFLLANIRPENLTEIIFGRIVKRIKHLYSQ